MKNILLAISLFLSTDFFVRADNCDTIIKRLHEAGIATKMTHDDCEKQLDAMYEQDQIDNDSSFKQAGTYMAYVGYSPFGLLIPLMISEVLYSAHSFGNRAAVDDQGNLILIPRSELEHNIETSVRGAFGFSGCVAVGIAGAELLIPNFDIKVATAASTAGCTGIYYTLAKSLQYLKQSSTESSTQKDYHE